MSNPNPSPATRFKPGSTPNPGGKSKELKRLEVEAAEMAAKLRHAALSSMMDKLSQVGEDGSPAIDPAEMINADTLRLFKDSEDRAHGTPKATTEVSGPEGGPVHVVRYEVIDPPKRE